MLKWLKEKDHSAHKPAEHQDPPVRRDRKGKIFIITGSSGSGRKTIAKLLSLELQIPLVKSYTTRAQRPNEYIEQPYQFVSEEQFLQMKELNAFFQTIKHERGSYGIAKQELLKAIETFGAAIVVVNREGSLQFKRTFGDQAIRTFIYCTKEHVLANLEKNRTPPEVLQQYLNNYSDEVYFKRECEHVIQNMDLHITVKKIVEMLQSNK